MSNVCTYLGRGGEDAPERDPDGGDNTPFRRDDMVRGRLGGMRVSSGRFELSMSWF